jgi:hypothetical protein
MKAGAVAEFDAEKEKKKRVRPAQVFLILHSLLYKLLASVSSPVTQEKKRAEATTEEDAARVQHFRS